MFARSFFFFFKHKTAYEMRISDWSSDVCSSDLLIQHPQFLVAEPPKPLCQLFRIANHPSMITGENDHKKEFRVKPAWRSGVDVEREHQPEYPDDHARSTENNLTQTTFTANPANSLFGTKDESTPKRRVLGKRMSVDIDTVF